MIDKGKQNVLGVLVDAVDYESAVEKIICAARLRRSMAVSATAVHGIMIGFLDPVHRHRLNHFDLLLPDGQPVRWALNWLHKVRLMDRVYGPELMLKVCKSAAREGLSIYMYGSKPSVIRSLQRNLNLLFPELIIAGMQPSLFRTTSKEEKQEIIKEIEKSKARIIFVGLGCPIQEVWAYEYRSALSRPIVTVGAAFDLHSGMLSQSPICFQRMGLEWLYRLALEPRRLWKRYAFLNPLYLLFLAIQFFKLAHFDPMRTKKPEKDLLYG